jgi:hypothetical protein
MAREVILIMKQGYGNKLSIRTRIYQEPSRVWHIVSITSAINDTRH